MARTTFARLLSDIAVTPMPFPLEKRSRSEPMVQQEDNPAPKRPLLFSATPLKSCLKVKTLQESLQEEHTTMQDIALTSSAGFNSKIQFSTIEIRLYSRCLGDNPSVQYGPPLSIDWHCFSRRLVRVDDYEDEHPSECRTDRDFLVVSADQREKWLQQAGYSTAEIWEATCLASKCRNQRLSTIKKLVIQARQEESRRAFRKRVNKMLRRKQQEEANNALKIDPSNFIITE